MKTVFYIRNCNTSKRIIKEAGIEKDFELRDIKEQRLTQEEVDTLAALAGSYRALFSKNARKYREYKLHLKNLSEDDYRSLIIEDYTFLKRPTIVIDDKIFIGSQRNTVKELENYLSKMKKQEQHH